MSQGSSLQDPTRYTLAEVAERLGVEEATVREWLATFQWEREYDAAGHLSLGERDLEFLRVVKSLRAVDRSCESIVRIIGQEEPPSPEAPDVPPAGPSSELGRETLKAALKEMQAHPAKKRPFWQRWGRRSDA